MWCGGTLQASTDTRRVGKASVVDSCAGSLTASESTLRPGQLTRPASRNAEFTELAPQTHRHRHHAEGLEEAAQLRADVTAAAALLRHVHDELEVTASGTVAADLDLLMAKQV